jgi:hypothetical protein
MLADARFKNAEHVCVPSPRVSTASCVSFSALLTAPCQYSGCVKITVSKLMMDFAISGERRHNPRTMRNCFSSVGSITRAFFFVHLSTARILSLSANSLSLFSLKTRSLRCCYMPPGGSSRLSRFDESPQPAQDDDLAGLQSRQASSSSSLVTQWQTRTQQGRLRRMTLSRAQTTGRS